MIRNHILLFMLASGIAVAYDNIAGTGTASQTDDKETYSTADKAIDGNTDGVWKIGSANSIAMPLSTGPTVFWKLTFDKAKYIDRVVVWNRMDYRPSRIDGMRLLVGGARVKTFEYGCSRQEQYIASGIDKKATVIVLQAPDNTEGTISIAEVEVFGADAKDNNADPAPEEVERCGKIPRSKSISNIASLGTATQIDDYSQFSQANKAIDGNTYAYWTGNAANTIQLTKTAIPGRTWWKLTFPKPVYIERIVVFNRLQGAQNRMDGQLVLLDGVEVGKFTYTTANQASYPMDIDKTGTVLKMISREGGDGYLQMAEVQVFGDAIAN